MRPASLLGHYPGTRMDYHDRMSLSRNNLPNAGTLPAHYDRQPSHPKTAVAARAESRARPVCMMRAAPHGAYRHAKLTAVSASTLRASQTSWPAYTGG